MQIDVEAVYDYDGNLTTNIGLPRVLVLASIMNINNYDYAIGLKQAASGTYTTSGAYLYVDGNHGGESLSSTSKTYYWRNVGGVNKYDNENPEIWTGTGTGVYVAAYDVTYWLIGYNFQSFVLPYDGDVTHAAANPYMFMGTAQNTDMAQAARAYFDTPAVPTFTAKAYIKDLPMLTIQWSDIDNLPPGMYPASYYIRIEVQDINHTYSPAKVALVPWKVGEYKSDYRDMLNNLYNEARELAMSEQTFQIKVQLGYIDPDLGTPDHFNAVNFVLLSLDLSTGDLSEDDPGTGNTVEIHNDDTPLSNDSYTDGTGTTATETGGLDLSVDNLLTSSYKVTTSELQAIGNFLWTNNLVGQLYENQVSPIENIISCKRLPFDVATEANPATIYLGNVQTPVTTAYRTAATHRFTAVTSYTFPVYCNNFLDFSTTFSIYLPYCGIHAIPTSLCYTQTLDSNTGLPKLVGNTLSVDYIYDILYGSCAAEVKINGATIGVFSGMCGVDIPLTQSSRANSQLAMDKAGDNLAVGVTCTLANAGLSALSPALNGQSTSLGDKAKLAGGTALSIYQQTAANQIEKTHQQLHYSTSGGFSCQISSYLNSKVVIMAEHAIYTEPGTYKHENGYPCNLSLYLGSLSGYTELDGSIEISGIQCYDEERELLKQALTEGFYLQEDPDPSLP